MYQVEAARQGSANSYEKQRRCEGAERKEEKRKGKAREKEREREREREKVNSADGKAKRKLLSACDLYMQQRLWH